MARPSILGNHPPTEAEVNHALECCKAIPHIREELLAMEQEMSDIKESLGKAESQNEQELYQFMLEEKEKKCQQKWESLGEADPCDMGNSTCQCKSGCSWLLFGR